MCPSIYEITLRSTQSSYKINRINKSIQEFQPRQISTAFSLSIIDHQKKLQHHPLKWNHLISFSNLDASLIVASSICVMILSLTITKTFKTIILIFYEATIMRHRSAQKQLTEQNPAFSQLIDPT